MYTLESSQLRASFDDKGTLLSLVNLQNGRNVIDSPAADSFKLVFKQGENWENVAFGHKQLFEVSQQGNRLEWTTQTLRTRDGRAELGVKLVAALEGETLHFDATIDNRTDAWVTDFVYPNVGVIKTLDGNGAPALLWPSQSGERITNVGQYLTNFTSREHEHNGHSVWLTYPGTASMQWMALTEGDQTLYLASHDADFHSSELRVRGSGEDQGAITMLINKFPFVKQGEVWDNPPVVLKLYTGDWHHGAQDYIDWAKTWRPYHQKPQWVQDMLGYFLVINKQQYGDEMWPYDTLPELYEHAKAHGCDTVGLFGWYDSGHDNQYPDLKVSETMGGADALRENIKKVQDAGGNVTLYFQGHLLDITTDYYKREGHKLETKSRWGHPYYEHYNKAHESGFLARYTNKLFSLACPCCTPWQDLMKEKADFVASFGPNGVLYDQIGGMPPYPCFDESHPHPKGKPSLSISNGRMALLDGIQKRTKQIGSQFGFFTEHITDLYSAYVDALHGIDSAPAVEGAHADVQQNSRVPRLGNYPQLFRYCFPDVVVTVRNPSPYIKPRLANYAFTFGFRYEIEIRYQGDCEVIRTAKKADWRDYAKDVNRLRKAHWDILGSGRYVSNTVLESANPNVLAQAYVKDAQLAVTLWNDTAQQQPLSLNVPGYRLVSFETLEGACDTLPKEMGAQQVAVARYEKL